MPIYKTVMDETDIEGVELSLALKGVIRDEGIAALVFIPLMSGRRLLGKFMVYFDAPHVFSDSDFDVALPIALTRGSAIAA